MFDRMFEQNLGRLVKVHLRGGAEFHATLVRFEGEAVDLEYGSWVGRTHVRVAKSEIVAVEADV